MTISNRRNYEEADENVEHVSGYIKNALLGEVFTTPKPGLVDLWDNGAHRDMNWMTFLKSTKAVTPYLTDMYETGVWFCKYQKAEPLEQLFSLIREIGKKAEKAMYQATDGVNTHKGMIFSMGIISAAYGYCYQQECEKKAGQLEGRIKISVNEIFEVAGLMTEKTLKKEIEEIEDLESEIPKTNGEYLLHKAGVRGIRGEVLEGFPVVRKTAYPRLTEAMKRKACDPKINQNQINLQILLFIMRDLCDTNVLSRGQEQGLAWVQKEAESIVRLGGAFQEEGISYLMQMNQECIRRNISSGGAADQLALTLFLWQIENQQEIPVYIPEIPKIHD